MQHLLKVDYFNEGTGGRGTDLIDKSDWIASLTCLNPILNGGIASYFFSFDFEKNKFLNPDTEGGTFRDTWFVKGCKAFSIAYNMLSPWVDHNENREIVDHQIKTSSAKLLN